MDMTKINKGEKCTCTDKIKWESACKVHPERIMTKHTPKGWEEKIAREAMMLYFLHFKEKDSMRNAWNYYWKKLQSLKKGEHEK